MTTRQYLGLGVCGLLLGPQDGRLVRLHVFIHLMVYSIAVLSYRRQIFNFSIANNYNNIAQV